MTRNQQYSLLLLAGGKSSRMGKDKAGLLYQGQTFLQCMIQKGKNLGLTQCYISGYASSDKEVTAVWDQYPNRGPLGGIHAGMKAIHTPYCLVLPVDAPTLPEVILEELLDTHERTPEKEKVLIWEHGERKEPLIAVYPIAMAETIEELIKERPAPVFRALDRQGYNCFKRELINEEIMNINTPELYERIGGTKNV